MEDNTYTITLADGTEINNLRLNGNNFVSQTPIADSVFAGKLDTVTITDETTGGTETLHDCFLARNTADYDGWYFVILQRSPDDRRKMDTDALLIDQEYRLTLLELGV